MKSLAQTLRPNRQALPFPRSRRRIPSANHGHALKGKQRIGPSRDAQGRFSWKARLFPILFFEIYLLASVLAFAFGPVDFPVRSPWILYGYVAFAQIIIFVGYYAGTLRRPCGYSGKLPIKSVLALATIVTLLLLPPTIHFRNYAELSLIDALTDPGAAYAARVRELANRESVSTISLLRGLFGPFLALLVPVGIVYSNRMTRTWRLLWQIAVLGIIIEPLLAGAAKGLFDLVLIIPWLIWVRMNIASSQHNLRPANLDQLIASSQQSLQTANPTQSMVTGHTHRRTSLTLMQQFALGLVTVSIVCTGILYFTHSRQSRYGLAGNEYPPWTTGWAEPNYGVKLPASIEYTVYTITRYWSQGYFGLSECLDLPFELCYGCGHSQVWMRYVGRWMSDPDFFWNRCYPVRLEYATGYEVAYYWHTIYPWLASDLTFPGAILFMGLMAFLFARAWSDTLLGQNPFAAGFVAQILLLFYYIPANNIRLMYSEEALTFWGLLAIWLITRKR